MRPTTQALLLFIACTIQACSAWPFFVRDSENPLWALREAPSHSLDGTAFDIKAPIDWDFLPDISICAMRDSLRFSVRVNANHACLRCLAVSISSLFFRHMYFFSQVTSNKESGPVYEMDDLVLVEEDGKQPFEACLVKELIEMEDITLDSYGYHKLNVVLSYGVVGEESATVATTFGVTVIPAPLSLLPPLVTLILAGWTHNVMFSLFLGITVGATFLNEYNPAAGLLRTLDTYLPGALGTEDHAKVVLFTLFIGGMVGILVRSGGAAGLAEKVIVHTSCKVCRHVVTPHVVLPLFCSLKDDGICRHAHEGIVGHLVPGDPFVLRRLCEYSDPRRNL
jgi:hypothetical protein